MCDTPLPAFPSIESSVGRLQTRHDLVNHSITIGFKDWTEWNEDTIQVQISEKLIHFVESDGSIVGIKVFSEASNG